MRAFKFRLESYLNLKDHEEKTAWNEVLKQQSRVWKIEEHMETIKEMIRGSRRDLSRSGVKMKYSRGSTSLIEESVDALSVRLQGLQKEKILEEKTLETLKLKFFEKKKDAKIIDNLKDRKKADFKKEKLKNEQKNNEEIARAMGYRKRTQDE